MKNFLKQHCISAAFVLTLLVSPFVSNASAKVILSGTVRADGKPLAKVKVSDGSQIVLTDAKGAYRMESDKAGGFVFVITPSNYVAKSKNMIQANFWAPLTESEKDEQHDFELRKEDQSSFSVLFITDVHLTNSDDKKDFDHYHRLVSPLLQNIKQTYASRGPLYGMNLGDLSHDLYWYQYNCTVETARDYLMKEKFPCLLYSVSGNHDNDGAIVGPETDRRAEWLYRKTFGPTYFSMDIGGIHWIMMDNILYKNTANSGKKNTGIAGARDYTTGFTPVQLEWLRRDLELVSSTTPVYLCTHIPILHTNSKGYLFPRKGQMDTLDMCFSKFSQVEVFSGHTHKMTNLRNPKYPRFVQHVLPATSGIMWTTSNDFQNICSDGADAGILVGTYTSDKPSYTYYTESYGIKVLRAYDMNGVADYYRNDPGVREQQKMYPGRLDYSASEYQNSVYVNYWCYAPGQKVQMFENGKELSVRMVEDEDPLLNISYDIPEMLAAGSKKAKFEKASNPHMFAAKAQTADAPIEIRIVDVDGKIIHTESMSRPKKFDKHIQ